jgi:hypothetical protein
MALPNNLENIATGTSENIIEQYILEWFWENNTLTLPKIGTFQAQYQNAQVTSANGELVPPRQTLKFEQNENPTDNEEFVQFIAQKTSFGKQASQNLLMEYVDFVQYDLNTKKNYTIIGVGTLLANPDKSISFQSRVEENIFAESFGLQTLKALPIKTDIPYKNPDLSAGLPTEESIKAENSKNQEAFNKNIPKENKPKAENTYKTTPKIENTTENITEKQEKSQDEKQNKANKNEKAILGKEMNLPAVDEVEHEEVVPIHKQLYFWIAVVIFLVCATFALLLMTDTQIFGKKSKNETVIKEPDDSKELAENDKKIDKKNENKKNENNKPENKKPEINEKGDVMDLLKMPSVSLREEFALMPDEPANLDKILITTPEKRYFIIVASFDNSPRAYSYYNNMVKFGFEMVKILKPSPQNPKYRISVADYSDKKLARLRNLEFDKKYRVQSWILLY